MFCGQNFTDRFWQFGTSLTDLNMADKSRQVIPTSTSEEAVLRSWRSDLSFKGQVGRSSKLRTNGHNRKSRCSAATSPVESQGSLSLSLCTPLCSLLLISRADTFLTYKCNVSPVMIPIMHLGGN